MRGDSTMNSCGLFSSSMEDSEHGYLGDDQDDDRSEDPLTSGSNQSNNKADIRKSNKPIMEKRRRARINSCLNELKGILLEAMRKDPARHSKLEKADILELTVRHLQNIQRNQLAVAMATDPTVLYRFKNGFSECASEVGRYMSKLDGVDGGMKQRVSTHLGACVNGLQQVSPPIVGAGPPGYPLRYPAAQPMDLPFPPPSQLTPVFSPPSSALIPPPNLTPPSSGDVNNNSGTPPQLTRSLATSAFTLVTSNVKKVESKLHSTSSSPEGPPPAKRFQMDPISESANPLDYSVGKVKHHKVQEDDLNLTPRPVRVVKVEPIHLSLTPEGSNSTPKDNMWRPW